MPPAPQTTCPSRSVLAKYAVGSGRQELRESIDQHLETCEACVQALSEIDGDEDPIVKSLRAPLTPDSFERDPASDLLVELAKMAPSPSVKLEAPPPAHWRIGKYEIHDFLGSGGMGYVYKAVHPELNKTVALKVLSQPTSLDRFRREMQVVAQLEHPNLVRATDAGQDGDVHFLVMDFVDGVNCSELLQTAGPLRTPDACEIVRQAALALQHAHDRQLVHRDVKPSNLMVDCQGNVKLMDLGLAHDALDHDELTASGQVMGTVDYMAPEQASAARDVDGRADIYSLGATLYKLLTGQAPFGGPQYNTTYKKLTALANEEIPPVETVRADLPEEVARAVARMLAKQPAARYATPADLASAIAPFCEGADLPPVVAEAAVRRAADRAMAAATTDRLGALTETQPPSGRAAPAANPPPKPIALRSRTSLFAAVAVGVVALLAFLVAPLVFRIGTDEGHLVIRIAGISDPVVRIDDRSHAFKVLEKDDDRTRIEVTVDPGQRKIELMTRAGTKLQTNLNDEVVTVAVGDELQIEAWLEDQPGTDRPLATGQRWALKLEGPDQHVITPVTFPSSGTFTIETWLAPGPEVPSDYRGFMGNWESHLAIRTGGLWSFLAMQEDPDPNHTTRGCVGSPVVGSQRVHVAGVCTGDSVLLFVDGRLTGTNTITSQFMQRGTRIGIGGHPQMPALHGTAAQFDEFRFSSTARYTTDFQPEERFQADDDTLAIYHFDEGQGSRLNDTSGNDHHATIVGGEWVRW